MKPMSLERRRRLFRQAAAHAGKASVGKGPSLVIAIGPPHEEPDDDEAEPMKVGPSLGKVKAKQR